MVNSLIVIVISRLLKRYLKVNWGHQSTSLFTSASTNQRAVSKG